MDEKNPIINVLNDGWSEELTKHSTVTINHIAKQMIPDLYEMAQKLQLETETDYALDELVNFGYIGIVSLITAEEKLNFDREELLAYTNDFLNKLIVAEKEWENTSPTLDCMEPDCLGKECLEKLCNKILTAEDISKEHALIEEFQTTSNYQALLTEEEKAMEKEKTKIISFDFYRKKR